MSAKLDGSAALAAVAMLAKGTLMRRLPYRERIWWIRCTLLLLIALVIACVFSGCTSLPTCIAALGNDTNSVSIAVSTPWGHGEFRRNLPTPAP